jgi:hypothetical protein
MPEDAFPLTRRTITDDGLLRDLPSFALAFFGLAFWLWWFATPSVPVYAQVRVIAVAPESQSEFRFGPVGSARRARVVPQQRLTLSLPAAAPGVAPGTVVLLRAADGDAASWTGRILDLRGHDGGLLLDVLLDAEAAPAPETSLLLRLSRISPARWLLSGLRH